MIGADALMAMLAAAAVAAVTVIWSALVVRRAVRDRALVRNAVVRLGKGEFACRLDEDDVDPHLATAFNQAARDLEQRVEAAEAIGERVRGLSASIDDQVIIDLDEVGDIRELIGDMMTLTGYSSPAVLGRHASFFFASDDSWATLVDLVEAGDPSLVSVAIRRCNGEIVAGSATVAKKSDGYTLTLRAAVPAAETPAATSAPVEPAPTDITPADIISAETTPAEQSPAEPTPVTSPVETTPVTSPPETPPESRQGLLQFLAALPDAVAILVAGHIASANEHFCQLLGLPAEELRGQPLTRFVAPRDLVRAAGMLAVDGSDAAEADVDLTLQTPGGNEITLAVRIGRADIGGQKVLILTAREVGARRDLQHRLAHYSTWLGATLEASREGMAVLASPTGRGAWPVVVANQNFLRVLGLSPDRLPGQEDLRRAMQETFADAEMVWAFLEGFAMAPESSGEGLFETRDQARTLRIESTPVHSGESDEPVGRLLAIRDVTRNSRLEDDLRAEAQALTQAVEALEKRSGALQGTAEDARTQIEELTRVNRELKELDEMKSNLLGNVSHELQTPLVSIKGYTEMMLRGDLGAVTAEQRQGLEVSRRNIQRLIGLIDQLLTFARTEERLTELTLEPFPLWQVIEETINLLGDRIKEKSLRVTTRYRTEDLTVMADRDLISQVVINLLGNAIKFNKDDGEVAISVRAATPDELVVEVRDGGIGIAREDQDRIFERGFRGTTSAGTPGSGIGLSVVREILQRHGCQVRVDSRPGEGTTFSFTLPLASMEVPPVTTSET